MNRSLRIAVFVVVIAVAIWVARPREDAVTPSPASPAVSQEEDRSAAQQPGMVVHIDPVTGERLETPPPDLVVDPGKSGPSGGFIEQPSPGGGVMVQLDGAFQHSAVATVDSTDSMTVECVPQEQAPQPEKDSKRDGGN